MAWTSPWETRRKSVLNTTRVVAVTMHSRMGEPALNLDRVANWTEKAHGQGASFGVFPEECITGSLNKTNFDPSKIEAIVEEAGQISLPFLKDLSHRFKMTLVVGTIHRWKSKFGNGAFIVGPDGLSDIFNKLWLPNENELGFFEPGEELLIVQSRGWTFSVGICADLNRAEYFRAAGMHGAEMFLMPVAGSGMADLVGEDGDQARQAKAHRDLHLEIMQEHALLSGMYVFYANQAGQSGGNSFPGLAMSVGPTGHLLDEHLPTEGMIVTEITKRPPEEANKAIENQEETEQLLNSSGAPVSIRKTGCLRGSRGLR